MQATLSRDWPIWEYLESRGIKASWLAAQIGYSSNHVYAVKAGTLPATLRFRQRCAAVLGRSEADLFGDMVEAEVTAVAG